MPSLTEAHHLWQEYMIWSRAQGLLDSKNKISVPLWLLLLLNRLAEKSEHTPELNKTGSNHFLKADSAYASDQGSVQGALEASLWQVARWPLCIFYVNFWLCNTSALLEHFFVNSLFDDYCIRPANKVVILQSSSRTDTGVRASFLNASEHHQTWAFPFSLEWNCIIACFLSWKPPRRCTHCTPSPSPPSSWYSSGARAVQHHHHHHHHHHRNHHHYHHHHHHHHHQHQVHALCNTGHVDLAPSARTNQYLAPRQITTAINQVFWIPRNKQIATPIQLPT